MKDKSGFESISCHLLSFIYSELLAEFGMMFAIANFIGEKKI
jgi:hypothetical protein